MSEKPVLILQMQRMGDLVLSFPLLGWLRAQNPARPLWVVGEERFFNPLLSLSPTANYFSYECAPDVKKHAFSAVINLSHRPEAARLAGRAKSEALFGPWSNAEGTLFVNGGWQLYRASLTHNNTYNHFHWADLNALDSVTSPVMAKTRWPMPQALSEADKTGTGSAKQARIGLFLGASEPAKHPDAPFWANLAALLLKRGHRPVFLGGKSEQALGREAARILGTHALNLAGRFDVYGLAQFIQELDLLITPDTGPMHIASWTGARVLNLSMGPVNPWETGPSSPGHYILRPALDCAGCWQCTRESLVCKALFTPEKVAAIIARLFSSRGEKALTNLQGIADGLELLRTGRSPLGLYGLTPLYTPAGPEQAAREAIGDFWQAWFAAQFKFAPASLPANAAKTLQELAPRHFALLENAAAACLAETAKQAASGRFALPADHWKKAPPPIRPLTGYMQMYAQNASGSPAALRHILAMAENLHHCLTENTKK